MLKKLEFKQYNFQIIDFGSLFHKKIETNLINDLYKYDLFKARITTHAKLFFYHHIILELCEFLLNIKSKEKTIIYFNNTQTSDFLILKYFKETEILKLLTQILERVKYLLPIKIFFSNISIDFLHHLLEKKDGRGIENIHKIRMYMESVNLEKYTFSRIKVFTKKNNLVFLNQDYFNRLKSKQLIIA